MQFGLKLIDAAVRQTSATAPPNPVGQDRPWFVCGSRLRRRTLRDIQSLKPFFHPDVAARIGRGLSGQIDEAEASVQGDCMVLSGIGLQIQA